MKRRDWKMITFEQYLQFYRFSSGSNISRSNLNQIIEMHGFVKLHSQRKFRLEECLESIELMDPTRSTLEESISSCAIITADEIAMDLADLCWQECLLVRSVQTLKSEAEQEYIEANEDLAFVPRCATSADGVPRRRRRISPAEFVIVGKRPRSKRKRVSVNALVSSSAAAAVAAAVSSVSSSSRVVVKEESADYVPPLPLSPPPVMPPPPSSPPPPLSPTASYPFY